MRSTTARLSLVAAGLAVVGLVGGAHAAPPKAKTLVITDPAADGVPAAPGDIVKVTFTTAGKASKKAYTPTTLVVTIETSDDIDDSGTTTYEVDADLPGCDAGLSLYFTPGVDGSEGGGCLNGSGLDITSAGVEGPPTVSGKTVTFSLPIAAAPAFKPGNSISGIVAFTALVDPVVGFVGPYFIDSSLANDDVTSDATYKIG